MNRPTQLSALGAILVASATFAHADQILVDPWGAGDALTIQAGVLLADPGDVIVVYPGTFTEDVTVTEGVWIVPQQAGTVAIRGSITIQGVPRGDQIVLMDLQVASGTGASAALSIVDCDALVQISNCSIRSESVEPVSHGALPAVSLLNARRVNLSGTTLFGHDATAGTNGLQGGHALKLMGSRAAIWGGAASGGAGLNGTPSLDLRGPGGDAISATGSDLFCSGTEIQGGRGGDYGGSLGIAGERGGDGIVSDSACRIYLVDALVSGGPGGDGSPLHTPPTGIPFAGSGAARFLPGAAETHSGDRFAFAQGTLEMTVRGGPGKRATLYLTTGVPSFLLDSLDPGSGPLGLPSLALSEIMGPLGAIPPSGELQATVSIPALPASPGILPATFFVVLDGGRRALFGAPLPVVGLNCDTLMPDCDGSGMSDFCEIAQGLRPDVNGNGRPDSCGSDCNANGVEDSIDIANGMSTDLNGNLIPDDCEPSAASWYVSATAAPGGTGSPTDPFASLADVQDVILPGHEVVFQDGVHSVAADEALEVNFANFSMRSENGPDACTLQLSGRALSVTGHGDVRVEGIAFRGGTAPPFERGGAIVTMNVRLALTNCVFDRCQATGGGAVSVVLGGAQIRRCQFIGNSSPLDATSNGGGGALRLHAMVEPDAVIDDCTFDANGALGFGMAVLIYQCSRGVTVSRSQFRSNRRLTSPPWGYGGAVALEQSPGVHFTQCLIAANAVRRGGAIYAFLSQGLLISGCTIYGNEADYGSVLELSGPASSGSPSAEITNSILWGNVSPYGHQIYIWGSPTTIDLKSSNIEGGVSSILIGHGAVLGTIQALVDSDPLFRDPLGPDNNPLTFLDNDYSLLSGSPSVDAGNNALIAPDAADVDADMNTTEPSPYDLSGAPRRFDDTTTPDTGTGGSPIVDHGALERQ